MNMTMTKSPTFALMSDLHMEHREYPHDFPEADCLLLAGDICNAFGLTEEAELTKHYRGHRNRVSDFLNQVSGRYERVIAIMGNHEHYWGQFDTTHKILRELYNKYNNVVLLDNESTNVGDVRILGSTLWADFDDDAHIASLVARSLNDYRVIRTNNQGKLLTSDYVAERCYESKNYLANAIDECPDDMKLIIMTHNAPSVACVNPKYGTDPLNHAFYTDCSYLLDPKTSFWVHGHMHDAVDKNVNGVRILANPLGYPGERQAAPFNPYLVFSCATEEELAK